MRWWPAALLSVLLISRVAAAQLVVRRAGERIDATLTGLPFPSSLPKDLKSGLSNHIIIHFGLELEGGRVEEREDVDVAVRYDLWDENFPMTETADRVVMRKEIFATLDEAVAFLENLRVPGLFATSRLLPGRTYRLSAEVLLNPIEKERLQHLKAWVAENSGTVEPAAPSFAAPFGQEPTAPPALAEPSSIFDRIFRRYAAAIAASATWHRTLVSPPFTAEGLSK